MQAKDRPHSNQVWDVKNHASCGFFFCTFCGFCVLSHVCPNDRFGWPTYVLWALSFFFLRFKRFCQSCPLLAFDWALGMGGVGGSLVRPPGLQWGRQRQIMISRQFLTPETSTMLFFVGVGACVTCRYLQGAKEVIEETKITAGDELRQQAISFYDNKFGSLVPLKAAYFIQ